MKLSTLFLYSTVVLAMAQTPARGFSLDLFSEEDGSNQADFYNAGSYLGTFPTTGQRVVINESTSGTGLVYGSTNTDSSLSTAIGGNRHLKITASNTNNLASLETATTEYSNSLNLNTNSNVVSTGLVVWNGSSSIDYDDLTANASLNVDLEADNDDDDSIGINVKFADLGGTLDLTLYDGTNTHTTSQSIPTVSSGSPETLYYNFFDYSNAGVNINSVDYISMELTGPAGSDIEIDFIETVKEIPFNFSSSLGLIVSGSFFGFLGMRRKKIIRRS